MNSASKRWRREHVDDPDNRAPLRVVLPLDLWVHRELASLGGQPRSASHVTGSPSS